MEIKKASIEDFDTAFEFFCDLWYYNTYDKAEMKDIYKRVIADKNSFFYFLVEDGEYKGFCHGSFFDTFWLSGLTCYLSSLFVKESDRGKGYGTALIDFVKALAKEKDCKGICLDSGLSRIAAHKFYESNGFIKNCYGFDINL